MSTDNITPAEADHNPVTVSSVVAVGAAVVAAVAVAFSSILLAVVVGTVSLLLFVLGLLSGYRLAVGVGAGVLFFGLVMGATFGGTGVEVLLVGVVATILAWDVGENAINLGEQVSRTAPTVRAEALHVAASATVGAVGAGLAYATYTTATGGKPLTALFALLLGVLLTAWVVRK
jgi:hypothetical protein